MPHQWSGCRRSHAVSAESGDFTIPGAEAQYPPDLGLEPTHLDITLAFDVPQRSAQGRVVSTVRANRAGVSGITLHAVDFEDLAVEDTGGKALTHRYDGAELRVDWEEPFTAGEQRSLAVSYRVQHPTSGLHFGAPDETYPDRASWVATDHETERARYWLPCIDLPAVRTTLEFHLTADASYTILANGLLESDADNGDGTRTAHWKLDYPCPSYLVCMAIGEFERADDRPVGDIAISYFCAKGRGDEADLLRSFGHTPAIMEWLQKRVGNPFPFPKYFQFGLPGFGGAMENISLVSWDDRFVADEVLHSEIGDLIEIVNVHEMAHSYFGDAVVIRDFAHAWLKESWAVYIEACWWQDQHGRDAFHWDLHQNARAYCNEADNSYKRPIVTRVFNSSWDMYDRHLYPGGSWRLHMLRCRLGEDVFWGAVADYIATYSKRTVETADFQRKLEEHSGLSLGKFFDQWIHGTGYPSLKADWSHDKEKGEGTLALEQTQEPRFDLQVTVAWEDSDGDWHRREVELKEKKGVYVLDMAAAPRQLRIDPDVALLHRLEFNPGDDMLRHAVRKAPDIVGRILAAEELLKTGKQANFDAVAEACAEEPFHGVRLAIAQAAGESKSAAAVPLLAGCLERETDPRVQQAIAVALGRLIDERAAPALEKFLDSGPTYRAAAAALEALGKQGGMGRADAEATFARLDAASFDDGFRGIVRAGGLTGLAATRTEQAFERLRGAVAYGKEPDDVRPVAASALALVVDTLEPRFRKIAIRELITLLRDRNDRVRLAAARALGRLGATEAIGDLTACTGTLAVQDAPVVQRIIQRIRKNADGSPRADALGKELAELRETSRKLEERLARLEAKGAK